MTACGAESADIPTVADIVRGIWSEALRGSAGDLAEDFFVLGGDSQIAIRIMTAIESATEVRLSLEILFEKPTLGALIDHVTESAYARDADVQDSRTPPITPRPRRKPLGVSSLCHPDRRVSAGHIGLAYLTGTTSHDWLWPAVQAERGKRGRGLTAASGGR